MDRLFELNMALVRSIAARYAGRAELEDLVQIGSLGLLAAVRGFDAERGTCFSTYAVPRIAGEIKRYLRDNRPLKVSRRLKEISARARKACAEFERAHGRQPTIGELAAVLGLTSGELAEAIVAQGMAGAD